MNIHKAPIQSPLNRLQLLLPEGPTCNLLYGDCIGALWTLPVFLWLSCRAIALAAQKVVGSFPREHTY